MHSCQYIYLQADPLPPPALAPRSLANAADNALVYTLRSGSRGWGQIVSRAHLFAGAHLLRHGPEEVVAEAGGPNDATDCRSASESNAHSQAGAVGGDKPAAREKYAREKQTKKKKRKSATAAAA